MNSGASSSSSSRPRAAVKGEARPEERRCGSVCEKHFRLGRRHRGGGPDRLRRFLPPSWRRRWFRLLCVRGRRRAAEALKAGIAAAATLFPPGQPCRAAPETTPDRMSDAPARDRLRHLCLLQHALPKHDIPSRDSEGCGPIIPQQSTCTSPDFLFPLLFLFCFLFSGTTFTADLVAGAALESYYRLAFFCFRTSRPPGKLEGSNPLFVSRGPPRTAGGRREDPYRHIRRVNLQPLDSVPQLERLPDFRVRIQGAEKGTPQEIERRPARLHP